MAFVKDKEGNYVEVFYKCGHGYWEDDYCPQCGGIVWISHKECAQQYDVDSNKIKIEAAL